MVALISTDFVKSTLLPFGPFVTCSTGTSLGLSLLLDADLRRSPRCRCCSTGTLDNGDVVFVGVATLVLLALFGAPSTGEALLVSTTGVLIGDLSIDELLDTVEDRSAVLVLVDISFVFSELSAVVTSAIFFNNSWGVSPGVDEDDDEMGAFDDDDVDFVEGVEFVESVAVAIDAVVDDACLLDVPAPADDLVGEDVEV